MLLTALAENPATPAAAVSQVADTLHLALRARARAKFATPSIWALPADGSAVLAHPRLAENHRVLDRTLPLTELRRALTSPLLTDQRAHLLLSHADVEDLGVYLREPDPHPAAFTLYRNTWTTQAGTPQRRIAACHRAAPRAYATEALAVTVQLGLHSEIDRDSFLTAATRHPCELTHLSELTADRDLARRLAPYAARPDPYQARLDDVITRAIARGTDTQWVYAIHTCPEPAVLAAALAHSPGQTMWNALREVRLPDAAKAPLMAAAMASARIAGALSTPRDVTFIARVATLETLAELAGTNLDPGVIPALLSRPDLPAGAIHDIVAQLEDTLQRGRRQREGLNEFDLDSVRTAGAYASAHPNTSATDRIRAADLTRAWSATQSAPSDRGRDAVRASQLATIGRRLATDDPADVARDLPVELLHSQARDIDAPGVCALLRLALTTRTADLTDPGYTRALLALAPEFPDTLGELIDTARTVST